MPKISALPAMTSADGADPAPIVDDSAGSTKKITLTKMKEWLQSLTAWITGGMIDWSAASMAARVTTDAAGWRVINMGKYKVYTKSVSQATFNIGASDRAGFTAITLPTGMTNLTNTLISSLEIRGTGYPGNFFVGVGVGSFTSATSITGLVGNNYAGGTLATGAFTFDVTLIEYL